MSTIDWSKAPKGATHYQPKRHDVGAPDMWCAAYWRLEGEVGVEAWQVDDETGGLTLFSRPTWMKETADLLIRRPWSGEGLPPVGAELEAGFACEEFHTWHKGVCVAVGEDPEGREEFCVVKFGGKIAMYTAEGQRMRPARTPEQIAAEEREKARDEVLNAMAEKMAIEKNETLWQHRLQVVGEMLDMGYRKQVMP